MTLLSPTTILFVILLYIGLLFLLAQWVEHKAQAGVNLTNNPVVYSLSLAVYCTAWSFYGSVGLATTSGLLFLTISLGPTMILIFGWQFLRKLVRIKEIYRITSIADFLGARYGKSVVVAAIASLVALVGIVPYISVQLKSVITTFAVITDQSSTSSPWIENNIGIIIVCLMTFFTIVFGVRRLDPTERHQGMVAAVAAESLIKLMAVLATGFFVTYWVFNGFDNIFQAIKTISWPEQAILGETGSIPFITVCSYLFLSMSAFMFLPRQFHVAVVENSNEKHIRTAMWLFPLYLLLINLFIYLIAGAGRLVALPASQADTFLLEIPLLYDKPVLALFVFIGGLSASTSMIMISSMTLATMMSNHLFLPLLDWLPRLAFLRRHLLKIRWISVAMIIVAGYWFAETIGARYSLVGMGIMSFVAFLQFAPSMLGGIFWRHGNHVGAILGLCAGCVVWFYTLIIPMFAKAGILSADILLAGPWGVGSLNPHHLFGITALEPISHAVVWTMLFNIGFYIMGSLFYEADDEEKKLASDFVDVFTPITPALSSATAVFETTVSLPEKRMIFEDLLNTYFPVATSKSLIENCLSRTGTKEKTHISVVELGDIYNELEKMLTGSIGSATAHKAMQQKKIFDPLETDQLQKTYGEILTDLKLSPEELRRRIDFYKEKEALVTIHAEELEEKIIQLHQQITKRQQAEVILAEQVSVLSLSSEIAIILTKGETLHEVLQQCCEALVRYLDVAFARIWIINHNKNILELQASAGMYTHLDGPHSRISMNEGNKIATIVLNKKPHLTNMIIGDLQISDQQWAKDEAMVAFAGHPLLLEDRAIGAMAIFSRHILTDITSKSLDSISDMIALGIEHKVNELSLRKAKDKAQRYLETANVILLHLDLHGFIKLINPTGLDVFGYDEQEILGKNWFETICSPDGSKHMQALYKKTMCGHEKFPDYFERRIITKSGQERIIDWRNRILKDENGKIRGTLFSGNDITEKNKTEEALKESRERLRSIIDTAGSVILMLSPGFEILEFNPEAERLFGHSRADVLGKNYLELFIPEDQRLLLRQQNERVLYGTPARDFESDVFGENNTRKTLLWNVDRMGDATGQAIGVLATGINITERKQAEIELANAHALLKSLIDSVPDLIFFKDTESVYLGCNKAFSEFAGKDKTELIGKIDFDLFNPVLAKFFREKDMQTLATRESQRNEEWVDYPDGRRVLLDTLKTPYYSPNGTVLGLIGVSRDITERKKSEDEKVKLEVQLRQAQKLEAIGTLAGGIAHDFNNILFAILGNADIAEMEIDSGNFPNVELQEIQKAGLRARDLVRQILSFARKQEQKRVPLRPISIIKEVLKLLRSTIPTTIEIKSDLQDSEATIIADPTEIHQLIMNLCTNAGHAMMDEGGVLEVSQKCVELDEDFIKADPQLHTGPYLFLMVSDTGVGIESDIQERIFEPFFTTKGKTEGTGMGLSVVHGIIISIGGAIKVNSEAGRGTSFKMYLPLAESASGYDSSTEEKTAIPKGRQEHILLVDDDVILAGMLEKMLTNLNYRVTKKTDSKEALQAFLFEPENFDLVITDQTMPHMTGADLAIEILKVKPQLPVMLCTGYSQTISEEQALEIGIREYMTKPVMKKDFAVAVRKHLDATRKNEVV